MEKVRRWCGQASDQGVDLYSTVTDVYSAWSMTQSRTERNERTTFIISNNNNNNKQICIAP